MKREELNHTMRNLWRSRRFIDLASEVEEQGESHSDLLGAAIIFLHATLEEYLRLTAIREWPKLESEKLQSVVKRYSRLGNKNVKLSLTNIIDYRAKTFANLLEDEIHTFLYQSMNFNSLDEVRTFLATVGVSIEEILPQLGQETIDNISSLIHKRHLIAHQADCTNLDIDLVVVWGKSLQKFLISLSNQFGLNVDYLEELKQIRFRK